jgi:hypothetical protein
MVSDRNTWRNILTTIFLCLLHKGIIAKGESSCYLLKVLALGQKLILRKPSNCASKLVKWFLLQHQSFCAYLKIHANEICNIYDKQMHLQSPFQSLYEQEVWGGWRSRVWQCWRDQLIQKISHVSMDLMRCS